VQEKDMNSLSHTTWRCQYHVVLTPKFRRRVIYREIRQDIGQILRKLCAEKGVEIIEAEACPDHIHMLLSIPPKYSVAQIMGYLKGKSSLMIFDRHANLKYKYGNRHFWCRGYFADTVGRNKEKIREYIRHQLDDDQMTDQISMKEYLDPFTGSQNTKA
jgi:putative transposase